MKIITKYLSKTIITYVSLVMLFLFGLQVFVEFTHEFPSLGVGNYDLYQMLIYVLLTLPYDIYQFFPMASLLGFIIALGLLVSNSELIVMRASGVSLVNIVLVVVKVSIVLLIVMVLLGEVLSPMAQRKASRIKATAISGGKVLLTRQGIWLHHKNGVTNVNSISNNGELQDITSYQFSDGIKLQSANHAAKGIYKDGKWIFDDVVKTEFKDAVITGSRFLKQESDLKFSPRLIGIKLDVDQKSLFSLYSYIKYRKLNGLEVTQYLFAFWQRVFAPLALLVMTLFAVPFVLGALRDANTGLRMLVGIMFGFGFHILYQFFGSMSIVCQIPPLLASVLPLLIFTAIGGVFLCRVR